MLGNMWRFWPPQSKKKRRKEKETYPMIKNPAINLTSMYRSSLSDVELAVVVEFMERLILPPRLWPPPLSYPRHCRTLCVQLALHITWTHFTRISKRNIEPNVQVVITAHDQFSCLVYSTISPRLFVPRASEKKR